MLTEIKRFLGMLRPGRTVMPLGETKKEPETASPALIAICNQKGGCGKTTTAINLAAALAASGAHTLLIDLDPQAHATLGLGLDLNGHSRTMVDLFQGTHRLESIVMPTAMEKLWIAPANSLLAGAAVEIAMHLDRESILRGALHGLPAWYEYVLIDCSPSLNLLTLNALAAVRHLLIPLQLHYFALEGMKELFQTVELVRERFNERLDLLGIVPVMVDLRHDLSRNLLAQTQQYFGAKVFPAPIRWNERLVEAAIAGRPISLFDPRSDGAQDYQKLAEEVTRRLRGGPVESAENESCPGQPAEAELVNGTRAG